MPRLSVRMSEETRERLERLSVQRMDSSLNQTIIHLIESGAKVAPERRQNGATPRERASSPSAQKEINKYNRRTEAVGSDASQILPYCKDNKNSNKAPPAESVFMPDPDNWEPQGNFRATWCASKGYDYAIAIEIFRDRFKADPSRCKDWNAKWRVFVVNGYLQGAKFSAQSNGYEEDGYGPATGRVKTDEEVAESRRFFAAYHANTGTPQPCPPPN